MTGCDTRNSIATRVSVGGLTVAVFLSLALISAVTTTLTVSKGSRTLIREHRLAGAIFRRSFHAEGIEKVCVRISRGRGFSQHFSLSVRLKTGRDKWLILDDSFDRASCEDAAAALNQLLHSGNRK